MRFTTDEMSTPTQDDKANAHLLGKRNKGIASSSQTHAYQRKTPLNKPQDKSLNASGTKEHSASEHAVNPPYDSASTEAPLTDFLQRQTQHRAESAEAFQQDTTNEPTRRELLEEQVKLQRQVRGIKNHVMRVQQGLLICQFLNVLIAGALVAIAAFLYLRSDKGTPIAEIREPPANWVQENKKINEEWSAETVPREKTEVTPDHVFIISGFMKRARELRIRESDDLFARQDKKAKYLNLLVDLSKKGEKFAAQREPRKACEMLTKVAKYAKGNQEPNNETPEQQELLREIDEFCRFR